MLPSWWGNSETSQIESAAQNIRHNFIFGVGVAPGMSAQSVTSEDILNATQELEQLIEDWSPRTELQNQWIQARNDVWEGKILNNDRTIWDDISALPWIDGNEELLDGQNEESLLTLAESRISQKFLERHQDVLFS